MVKNCILDAFSSFLISIDMQPHSGLEIIVEASFIRKLRKLAYGYSHATSSRLSRVLCAPFFIFHFSLLLAAALRYETLIFPQFVLFVCISGFYSATLDK